MSFLVLSTLAVALAGLHVSEATNEQQTSPKIEIVELESFRIGMSVTAVFTAPSIWRTIVSLWNNDGGIVLNMAYRKNFRGFQDVLVLSSRPTPSGEWGPPQYVRNFTFTPGTILALTAEARYGHFSIIANGLQVANFDYRAGLPVESVKHLQFGRNSGDSKLVSLQIGY